MQPASSGTASGAPAVAGGIVLPYTTDAQYDESQTNLNGNPITNDETHAIYTTQQDYQQVIAFIRQTHAAAGYTNSEIIADDAQSIWNADFPVHATDLIAAYKYMDVQVNVPDSDGNVLVIVMIHDTSAD